MYPTGVSSGAPDGKFGTPVGRLLVVCELHLNGRGVCTTMVLQRRCSGKTPQVVIGHVIDRFMVQRCCLSVPQTARREADRLGSKAGELGPSTFSELRTAFGFVLIAYHEAGREPRRRALSVVPVEVVALCWNLSMSWGDGVNGPAFRRGGVFKALSGRLPSHLLEHEQVSRRRTTLLRWNLKTGLVPKRQASQRRSHVGLGAWLAGDGWKRKDHTDHQGCRSALMGLRRACRQPCCRGKVVVFLRSNLSEIQATSEGRARDFALDALCRSAFLLAADVSWVRRHQRQTRQLSILVWLSDGHIRLAEAFWSFAKFGKDSQRTPVTVITLSEGHDQNPITPSLTTTAQNNQTQRPIAQTHGRVYQADANPCVSGLFWRGVSTIRRDAMA